MQELKIYFYACVIKDKYNLAWHPVKPGIGYNLSKCLQGNEI